MMKKMMRIRKIQMNWNWSGEWLQGYDDKMRDLISTHHRPAEWKKAKSNKYRVKVQP